MKRIMSSDIPLSGISSKYQKLIQDFINCRMSAPEFQSAYIAKFKNDGDQTLGVEFDILDGLFSDADDYCPDPNLRSELRVRYSEMDPEARNIFRVLDDDQFRERAREAYRKLYES